VLALVLLLAFYEERAPRGHAATTAKAGFRTVIAIPGVIALLGVLFVVNFIGRSFTPILPCTWAGSASRPRGSPRRREC
jgi:hypothetical protein